MATSDEFDGDLSLWTEVDPVSAGTFTTTGGQLQLAHAAIATDMFTASKNAPRLVQALAAPLDIAAKLGSITVEDEGYGLLITDGTRTNVVRLDWFTNAGNTRLFFAHVNGAAATVAFNAAVPGNPLHLRIVMPDADSAEGFHSADGETWTSIGTIDLTVRGALTAAEAGPYGTNAFVPGTPRTYLWDWVRFDLQPGGSQPAAGTAAFGMGFELAAAGSRPAAGTAPFGLGLQLAAAGSRPGVGSADHRLGLKLAAAGARDSAGAGGTGLGLQLQAAGSRPSQGEAHFVIGLKLAGPAVAVIPGVLTADATTPALAAAGGRPQLATDGTRPTLTAA